ncbi:MAG: glycosyltransferase family 39 protein [Verrucomicrobiae bacterium]|nr:glycosyltransferase family 39 protein [Verrucomicrobiae bacterium]
MKTLLAKRVEIALWILFLGCALAVRYYLIHFFPVYIWSKDSSSYVDTAFQWIHTGVWETDIRRGPIYSLFIGLILKIAPNLSAIMIAQHILGAIAIILAVALFCRLYPSDTRWIILLCGAAYGLYELPLYLEHLIRNETLLLIFATGALGAWAMALHSTHPSRWLLISGLSAGLLTLTKNIFLPFPFLVITVLFYLHFKNKRTLVLSTFAFIGSFLLPYLAVYLQHSSAPDKTERSSYAGVQFYGRVAQWTYLEGGLYPEIKTLIHEPVETYRKFKKPDNNVVIKKLIVPVIEEHLKTQGKGFSEVDRICRNLAFEAIRKNPGLFTKQVLNDLYKLHFRCGYQSRLLKTNDLRDLIDDMEQISRPDPMMHYNTVMQTLHNKVEANNFSGYYRFIKMSWLFEIFPPAFLTTLLLPLLFFFDRTPMRLFWLTVAGVWFFNIILLATVGRPLNRYFVPLAPLMFWTLTGTLIWLWQQRFRFQKSV